MDLKYIEANHVIERYLAGRLAPEQAEAFEVYCLEHPEVADELEYARVLKQNLQTELPKFRRGAAQTSPRASGSLLQWWQSPIAALSAAAMVGILVFWNFTRSESGSTATEAGIVVSPVAGPVISVGARRSANSPGVTTIGAMGAQGTVIVDLEIGVSDYSEYKVVFLGPDAETIWQSESVPINAGAVRVAVDTRRLTAGVHRFELYGLSGNVEEKEISQDYQVVITP